MSLDKNPVSFDEAISLAKMYYDEITLDHAKRVLYHVLDMRNIPAEYHDDCMCLAIMHDLIEDTDYEPNDLPENFKKALELLTKPKDMPYDQYCCKLHHHTDKDYGLCAWFVKLADIKDHLSQVDTLTPRLKGKYLSGLRYLL